MRPIKTHTFNGEHYKIDFVRGLDGATDTKDIPDPLVMMVLDSDDFCSFHSAFHEALEASGFCDGCMHDKNGDVTTIDAARFLWRMRERWRK